MALRNLSANVGVGALAFAVVDLWVAALVVVALVRGQRAEIPPLLKWYVRRASRWR